MPRTRSSYPPGILLSIAVTIPPLTAHAQSEVPVQQGALVIWDAALVAMDNHDYATACPKIEEVIRLRPDGLGAKLKLAECYEDAGRLASAWRMYVLIEPLAEEANQPDRKKTAHDRAAALRPKLATVTIVVPDAVRATPGLEIKCDDKVVEPAQWGAPLPVDKGRHVIVVAATGMERGERVQEIEADGAAKTVTIDPPVRVKLPADEVKPPVSKRSVVPAVVLGVLAAAGIGTGIGATVAWSSNNSAAHQAAVALNSEFGGCNPQYVSYDPKQCANIQNKLDAAQTYGNVAVGTFIVGGATAAGMVLYLVWPSPQAKKPGQISAPRVWLTPIVGPTNHGLILSGSF